MAPAKPWWTSQTEGVKQLRGPDDYYFTPQTTKEGVRKEREAKIPRNAQNPQAHPHYHLPPKKKQQQTPTSSPVTRPQPRTQETNTHEPQSRAGCEQGKVRGEVG